jgi:hypothetical protein
MLLATDIPVCLVLTGVNFGPLGRSNLSIGFRAPFGAVDAALLSF